MGLLARIGRVTAANAVQLITGVILGLLLPKVLSVDDYANYRTLTLMLGFVGVLHLGFVDGVNLRYAGLGLGTLRSNEISDLLRPFLVLEACLALVVFLVGFCLHASVLMILAAGVIPFNVSTFFQRLYQATDSLRAYSVVLIVTAVCSLVLSTGMLAIRGFGTFVTLGLALVVSNAVASLVGWRVSKSKIGYRSVVASWTELRTLIRLGFPVMVSNILLNLFFAVDRWIVLLGFDSRQFALYSFAVSMLNIGIVLLQAVSVSMFSYLASGHDGVDVERVKRYAVHLTALAPFLYFPLSAVIDYVVPSYRDALDVLTVSLLLIPYYVYVTAFAINSYKLAGKRWRYLSIVLALLCLTVSCDIVIVWSAHSLRCISLVTTCAFFLWYIFARFVEEELSLWKIGELTVLLVSAGLYLLSVRVGSLLFAASAFLSAAALSMFDLFAWRNRLNR